jgi:coenzyme F420-0:L-glutamate ligase/coenzyme F420-1:gamma-L-glutamate ligase
MKIELIGLTEVPLVNKKEDIANLIVDSIKKQNISLENQDIILIAETLIAKAEGSVIELDKIIPTKKAIEIAKKTNKDPKIVQVIIDYSNEIIAIGHDFIISETKQGFVCANAGIDESNVGEGLATPIPTNPDKSSMKIREKLEKITNHELAIIITDTQGRAFRNGAVGVAIGCSGINPIWERKGEKDLYNRKLQTTEIAIADELAGAASILMGQANEGVPIVIIRGFHPFKYIRNTKTKIDSLIRPKELDVFRK